MLCHAAAVAPAVAGGFRPQAQVADEALRVLQQALALQQAGCFALVLECIPGPIAAAITRAVTIPTIGIGAGPACSGQVRAWLRFEGGVWWCFRNLGTGPGLCPARGPRPQCQTAGAGTRCTCVLLSSISTLGVRLVLFVGAG